jgi:hypothetical protein
MRAELRMTLYTCLAVLTIAVQSYAQPQYTVTDLGTFQPAAITGEWIVGAQNNMPMLHHHPTATTLPLQHMGDGGLASAVLDNGVAAGWVGVRQGDSILQAACTWNEAGEVALLPGLMPSSARDINDAGVVVGSSNACPGANGRERAVRWWPGQTAPECLGPNASQSRANAVDASNRVWGLHANCSALWNAEGRLIGAPACNGEAYGANDTAGVGWSDIPASHVGTLFPDQGFPFTRLPRTALTVDCFAYEINAAFVVVGSCGPRFGLSRAVTWPDTSTVVDLTDASASPAVLSRALDINDDGKIIGLTTDFRGFLLTPVDTSPSLAITLNQTGFAPGQTLRMALEMRNPGPMLTTDVYVGIILPDGEQVVFLTNLSPLEGQLTTLSSNPRLFARLLQGVSWPANLRATQENYWVYTRSGLEANGTYHLVVAWTKPNSLEDGRIDEGDILALDWKAFQFTGPASTLAAKAQEIRARYVTK